MQFSCRVTGAKGELQAALDLVKSCSLPGEQIAGVMITQGERGRQLLTGRGAGRADWRRSLENPDRRTP